MKNNKKGQVVNFSSALQFVVALVVMGLIAAAGIIALVSFKSGQGPNDITTDNTSRINASIDKAVSGVSNFSAQLPTVGTMIGVGLVLIIIVGVFAFGLARRGGGGGL